MFKITSSKGFHIQFENGWTVSVQFGYGNYCDNYDRRDTLNDERDDDITSFTAEVAAWDDNGKWHEFEDGNTVAGRLKAADVLEFINIVSEKSVL